MNAVKLLSLQNGSATFNRGKEEILPSTSYSGNVTVNQSGAPGIAPHFEVSFLIGAEVEAGGVLRSNYFSWACIVPAQTPDVSYRDVETDAARMLAPMLRSLADEIEKDVQRADNEVLASGADSSNV